MPRRKKNIEVVEEELDSIPHVIASGGSSVVDSLPLEETHEEVKQTLTKNPYAGFIMVKKSPQFREWRGNPLRLEDYDEIVATDPNHPKVRDALSCGNLQFVSNTVKGSPRIIIPSDG